MSPVDKAETAFTNNCVILWGKLQEYFRNYFSELVFAKWPDIRTMQNAVPVI